MDPSLASFDEHKIEHVPFGQFSNLDFDYAASAHSANGPSHSNSMNSIGSNSSINLFDPPMFPSSSVPNVHSFDIHANLTSDPYHLSNQLLSDSLVYRSVNPIAEHSFGGAEAEIDTHNFFNSNSNSHFPYTNKTKANDLFDLSIPSYHSNGKSTDFHNLSEQFSNAKLSDSTSQLAACSPSAAESSSVASSSFSSFSSFPSVSSPPSVDCVGGYLEPSSHFFVSLPPLVILQQLLSFLQSQSVDCTLNDSKYKICCNAYRCGATVPFVVRIFTAGSEQELKKYAVEFQRRSGDVTTFYQIFRNARTVIVANKENKLKPPPPRAQDDTHVSTISALMDHLPVALSIPQLQHSFSAPPLEHVYAHPHSHTHRTSVCDTIKSLLQMCECECVDVRSSALIALANLSESRDEMILDLFVSEGVLEQFLLALNCTNEEVHRSALTGLANLATSRTAVCTRLMRCYDSMKKVYNLTGSDCAEVVRQTARTLCEVGKANASANVNPCETFRKKLQELATKPDPKVRAKVDELLEALAIQAEGEGGTINACPEYISNSHTSTLAKQ